jgi:hypothetical protein
VRDCARGDRVVWIGAAYQALLAAVAGIVAWVFFFDMVLDDPSAGTFRWLLLVLCVGYAVAAGGVLGALILGDAGGGRGSGLRLGPFLLLFSLGLVAYGAAANARGPAYVGFLGLAAFALLQGVEINALLEGDEPDSSFAGWPLALVLIGGAALAAGMLWRGPPSPEPETTYDVRS